jgi:predicted acyltransferase
MSSSLEQLRGSAVAPSESVIASVPPVPAKTTPGRLVSLDAFRGFIMLMLVSHGFGLYALVNHPQFSWLSNQFEHAKWEGLTFWDLIQPAFMFMVGVAMPFSLARRISQGDSVILYFYQHRLGLVDVACFLLVA